MSLIIKDEEIHQLAGELADLTGETMTEAIAIALRERLERERHELRVMTRIQRLQAIRIRCALLLRDDGPSAVQHGDLPYGEDGLPD